MNTAQADDRAALAARYLGELEEWLEGHDGTASVEALGFTGRDANGRTALARAARGAIQYAGGEIAVAGFDRIEPYGTAIKDTELRDRARRVGVEVLEALGRSRARHRAADTLELVRRAGIVLTVTERDIEALAQAMMQAARHRGREV